MHDLQAEIQERLRKRYLERLVQRVKKMRRNLADRSWEELRTEVHQLRGTGESFGFKILTTLAANAEDTIPPGKIHKAMMLQEARHNVEMLIAAIDDILTENNVPRG